MQRKTFVANWKLYCDFDQTVDVAEALREINTSYELVIAPATPFIGFVSQILHERIVNDKDVHIGAQGCDIHVEGAYTGGISVRDFSSAGLISHCIVGHSEQRAEGETDEMIGKKVALLHQFHIIPILCVGETKEQRAAGKTKEVISEQLKNALRGVMSEEMHSMVTIAYEPRWAISAAGKGAAATDEDITEAHALIKELTYPWMNVLYGGSVTADNCSRIMALPNVDGVLVGHASTQIDQLKVMLAT